MDANTGLDCESFRYMLSAFFVYYDRPHERDRELGKITEFFRPSPEQLEALHDLHFHGVVYAYDKHETLDLGDLPIYGFEVYRPE